MTRKKMMKQAEIAADAHPTMGQLWELVQSQKQLIIQQDDRIDSLQAHMAALDHTRDSENSSAALHPARLSRKGLLGAAAAGAAGLVGVGTLLRPDIAAAANGDPVLLGGSNTATLTTKIDTSGTVGVTAFEADSLDSYGIVGRGYGVGSGVWGRAGSGASGVFGDTVDGNGIGVYGSATAAGIGVQGVSVGGTGVQGQSTSFIGVYGNSSSYVGVQGFSSNNIGVYGNSATNYGGVFDGVLAPLWLLPHADPGAPTGQAHIQGEILVDSLGVPYVCDGQGTPGNWQAVGNLRSFPAGHRVFNNPMAPGGLNTGISALTDIHGGSTGVPATAIAIYCAVQSYESGTLTIFPDGASEPPQANWSGVGTSGILNLLYMIVPLSSAGKFSIRSHLTATGQVYVDVWGYLM